MAADGSVSQRSTLQWFALAGCIVLSAVLLATGGQKLLGTDQMNLVFEQLGMGHWLCIFFGLLEITAAAFLVSERFRFVGGLMAICLSVGAIVLYGANDLSLNRVAVLLALSVFVVWSHRSWRPRLMAC